MKYKDYLKSNYWNKIRIEKLNKRIIKKRKGLSNMWKQEDYDLPEDFKKCMKVYDPNCNEDVCALCGFSPKHIIDTINQLKKETDIVPNGQDDYDHCECEECYEKSIYNSALNDVIKLLKE